MWDDVRAGGKGKDGAGWVAVRIGPHGRKEKWFNIRTCGSWRLAFLLARIQRALWDREELPPRAAAAAASALSPKRVTPLKRIRSSPDTPGKRKLVRRPSDDGKNADS